MGSTPPKVTASPDIREWMRWAEGNFATSATESEGREIRVGAAVQGAMKAASQAGEANNLATEATEKRTFPTPSGAIVASLLDQAFWAQVISGARSVFGNTGTSSSTLTTATEAGLSLNPSADTAAWIDVTAIRPLPPTRKVFVASSNAAVDVAIVWYSPYLNEDGETKIQGSAPQIVTPGVWAAPSNATSYSAALTLAAGSPASVVADLSVFEVFGDAGLNISPGGVRVDDGSGNATTEINPSLPLLAAPTPPALTTGAASVSVRWNGNLTDGPAPAHLAYVFAEEAVASSGPWVRVGQSLNLNSRDIITRPPVGSTRWYRFTAMDTSGRPGAASASASIVVQGVSIPDLDGDIGDVIDTVDGLNKIFYQDKDNQPVAHANGDLWFVVSLDTATVTDVRIWNGTAWVDYRLIADSIIVPGSLGTVTIADGAITGDKVTARTLTGDKIEAGSLSVDELTPNIGAHLDITINPALNDVQSDIEQQQRVFRFDTSGIHIGNPATDEELRMDAGRIEMRQGNTIPSWWEANNFYAPNVTVENINFGSHQAVNFSNGRTVIRARFSITP